jgi:hypothetical protein
MEGVTGETPWKNLRCRIFLGDKGFVEKAKITLGMKKDLQEIPRSQRYAERPELKKLFPDEIRQNKPIRNKKEIADCLNIHYRTASKVVKDEERTT